MIPVLYFVKLNFQFKVNKFFSIIQDDFAGNINQLNSVNAHREIIYIGEIIDLTNRINNSML